MHVPRNPIEQSSPGDAPAVESPSSPACELARREFIAFVAAGALSGFSAPAQAAETGLSPADVRRFGAKGDGQQNDTRAFEAALQASRILSVPAGIYLVDELTLPANTALLTAGPETVFKQRPGLPATTRILNIVGSNVSVGSCTVEGNIATDAGEQRHGVIIQATKFTGDLSNIRLGNIRGVNLRGDVVYVGVRDGRAITNVHVANVYGSNVLRNVVSIVGGRQITIGRVAGSRVGFMHLDIEPDEASGPVAGCRITSVNGGFVQIAGQSAASYVDQVFIGVLNLTAPVETTIPRYEPGLRRADALTIRNVRSVEIGELAATNFPGAAIKQVWGQGEIRNQSIYVRHAMITNCCREEHRSSAYIVGNRAATRLRVGRIDVIISRVGVDVIRDCKEAHVAHISGTLPRSTRVIAESPKMMVSVAQTAAASALGLTLFQLARALRR